LRVKLSDANGGRDFHFNTSELYNLDVIIYSCLIVLLSK